MKKYSKQIALAVIIVVAIMITVISVYFNSLERDKEFKLGDYTVVSEGSGVSIVSYNGSATTLTIPAKVEGKKIVSIGEKAFNSSSVTTLSFAKDSSIEISDSAFSGNTTIVSVTLPDGIKSVPNYCFYNATSLKYVTMPDSITYIGNYAFYGCTVLGTDIEASEDTYKWYKLPASLTEICSYAFYNCQKLDGIYVPKSLTAIGASAFRESPIQKIELIPGSNETDLGITTIDQYAFYNTSLYSEADNELYFPNLKTIGKYAFSNVSGNKFYFRVAPSVTSIGDYAFSGSQMNTLVFEQDSDDETITLGANLCYACTSLKSVTMNISKINKIPDGMFMGCTNLLTTNDLVLSENVESIGEGAFNLYATTATVTSITQSKTILFERSTVEGNAEKVGYNEYFRVLKLADYTKTSGSTSTTKSHFVITDFDMKKLYAYVGLYSDTDGCTYTYNNKDAEAFWFFNLDVKCTGLNSSTLMKIESIEDYAFSGARFTKICLPGSVRSIGEKVFYKATIYTVYFDGNCTIDTYNDGTPKDNFSINENAFVDMSNEEDLLFYVIGTNYSTSLGQSSLKLAFDNLKKIITCSMEDPN